MFKLSKLNNFRLNSENCLIAIQPTKMCCCSNQTLIVSTKVSLNEQNFCSPYQNIAETRKIFFEYGR